MYQRYLNPGPLFLKGLAGLAVLFILVSIVLLQWQGFSDDDDSAVIEIDDDDSAGDDDSAKPSAD